MDPARRAGQASASSRGARGRESRQGLVATFPDVDDRDAVEAHARHRDLRAAIGAAAAEARASTTGSTWKACAWSTVDGVDFGIVSHLFSTGANDVLVARDGERERMIPFLEPDYVESVDFEAGLVTVDWDPEF